MPACKIDSSKSPDFASLCEHWRKQGYPSVWKDAEAAFVAISANHEALHCNRMQRFEDVLEGRLLLKYRFKDSAHREGARGGWRMIAVLDPKTMDLYPILIYPKKKWEVPEEDDLSKSVSNLAIALRQRDLPAPSP